MTRRRTQTPRRLAPRKLWIYLHSELSTRLDQGVDIVYVIWICKCTKMYHKPQSTMNPKQWSVCLSRSCRSRPVHSPHYSHSSLCPPAGSILGILRIVANIEPLPLPSPPAPLRKLWHKYFIVLWTKLHSSLLGGLLQSETICPFFSPSQ